MCLGELLPRKAKELVHYLLSPGSLPHRCLPSMVLSPGARDPRVCRCPGESQQQNSIQNPLLLSVFPWRPGHQGPTPLTDSPTLPGGAHKPVTMTSRRPGRLNSNWPPPGRKEPHRVLTQLSESGTGGELNLCVARMSPFCRYLETEARRRAGILPRPCRSLIPSSALSPEHTLGPFQ